MKLMPTLPQIEKRIFIVRGHKVMLDSDLAELYGIRTKALNQAVRRNIKKFPEDFAFVLTMEEFKNLRSQIVTTKQLRMSYFPRVFTEHGALMAASVLNSDQAVAMSIFIIRAFVKLREALISYEDLRKEIEAMRGTYDQKFQEVFNTLEKLLAGLEKKVDVKGFSG